MKLKVGDVVEFKKYEDMTDDERMMIDKDSFPSSGTVRKVFNNFDFFCIEGKLYAFNVKSIAKVISDVDNIDINSLKPGDEVLAKVTIKKVFNAFLQIESSIDKTDVTKILKRKGPERFIVQERYYGLYIGESLELVSDKSKAQVYADRDAAYQEATDMHLNAYEVLPYDD